jgi:hypothetical protein
VTLEYEFLAFGLRRKNQSVWISSGSGTDADIGVRFNENVLVALFEDFDFLRSGSRKESRE